MATEWKGNIVDIPPSSIFIDFIYVTFKVPLDITLSTYLFVYYDGLSSYF